MDANDWLKKWETSDIRFHKTGINPNLLEFEEVVPSGKVFVPLCGKSLDMDYLEKRGREVVGVEVSPIACRSFFEENGRAYEGVENGQFMIFKGKNITLWCGDFFQLGREALNGITSIFDRAALVSLEPEARILYAKHLKVLLGSSRPQILLITTEYPQHLVNGPPFSVPEAEIRTLFSDGWKVEVLTRKEDIDLTYNHPRFKGIPEIYECVYSISDQ